MASCYPQTVAAAGRLARLRMIAPVALTLLLSWHCHGETFLQRIDTSDGVAEIDWPADGDLNFLQFGGHSYAPDRIETTDSLQVEVKADTDVCLAPFQKLYATKVELPKSHAGARLRLHKAANRDAFWDQLITIDPSQLGELPRYTLVETGSFAAALPEHVRQIQHSAEEIQAQQQSLVDPHLPPGMTRELAWQELEMFAWPLDFQKVLLASPHDPSPGFAFQNGQWLTTWLSEDLPKWTKEDHWFAPALLIGETLVRPAPLSAETQFLRDVAARTLPVWKLRWQHEGITVEQTLFSQPASAERRDVYVHFQLSGAAADVRLVVGLGRRPNVHYWDIRERERTPIPFFTLPPGYRQQGRQVIDAWNRVILKASEAIRLEPLGPVEMLLVCDADERGNIYLRTPQQPLSSEPSEFTTQDYRNALEKCLSYWSDYLEAGAQVVLPSDEWTRRIDTWLTQIEGITRVHYQGQERLSYGAYFYQAYFGPEEGWPIVALAQWGRPEEAKRQAEIMLSAENRDKSNVHHQSRNGVFAWYSAEVARLGNERSWLQSIAAALRENADWTIAACQQTQGAELPEVRGLLPPHIYGGDVRAPATSLYATAVCYKGLSETAKLLRDLGTAELRAAAQRYAAEAATLRARLQRVIEQVGVPTTEPPFLPLALALPSLGGKHEGPYERLTASKLGNYWNLFAPSVLELQLRMGEHGSIPNDWLLGTMQTHGGLWAGLPRFYDGLDVAYSIGAIKQLIRRSTRDPSLRGAAVNSLQSLLAHAASRNGLTIPEVVNLFPARLDRQEYERITRESPWSFGMYDAEQYLAGRIPFTEPLGAAAGEALWLIREALVHETLDEQGQPTGELFVFAAVPEDWYGEGQQLQLRRFPTHYGLLSVTMESQLDSAGEIRVEYQFTPHDANQVTRMTIRFAPPGKPLRDLSTTLESQGSIVYSLEQNE